MPRWVQLGAAVLVIVIVVVALGSEGDEAGQPQVIAEAPAAADEVAPEAAEQPAPDEEAGDDVPPPEPAADADAAQVAEEVAPEAAEQPAPDEGAGDDVPPPEPAADADAAQVAEEAPPLVDYEVIRIDDVSFANVVRLVVRAVVAYPISATEASAVIDQIVADAAQEPVNAIAVLLYDDAFFVEGAFTVAGADFAPNGRWADADAVRAGDYRTHQTVYTFRPKLADPHGASGDRPSEADLVACAAFDAARAALDDPDAEDLEVARAASLTTGLASAEILTAVHRCVLWPTR